MLRYIMIGLLATATLSGCSEDTNSATYKSQHSRKQHVLISTAKLVHFKDGRVGFQSPDNSMLWYYVFLNNTTSTIPTSTRTYATFPSTDIASGIRTSLSNGSARIEAGPAPEETELAGATSLDETLGEIASDSNAIAQQEQSIDKTEISESGEVSSGSEGSASSGDSGSSSGDSGGGGE